MLCKPQILFLREQLLRILGIRPPSVFYIGGSDTLPLPWAGAKRTPPWRRSRPGTRRREGS